MAVTSVPQAMPPYQNAELVKKAYSELRGRNLVEVFFHFIYFLAIYPILS